MNMSMTENEIREEIKELKRKANIFENSGYATAGISLSFKKSVKVIEELLEELKQYREIGTVQGYERAIQCSLENYNLYKEYKSKVQDYEAIGTVEDVQEIFSLCKTLQEVVKKYSAIGTVEELEAMKKGTLSAMFEELKQYREIGTVRQVQDFIADWRKYREFGTLKDIEKSMQNVSVLLAENEVLKLYQAIGTIEEFKTLKENRFFNFDSSVVRIDEKSYNKAIDEFAERLRDVSFSTHENYSAIWLDSVDEIAEQLKNDELILENVDLNERE